MKSNRKEPSHLRQRLILAGLEELNQYGFEEFSIRRIAKTCGVSCAAPYKHFENKQDFITQIFGYINDIYHQRQAKTIARYAGCSTRQQLVEVSLDYIRFLGEYPHFRRIIMQNYQSFEKKYRCLRGQLSSCTYDLVSRYCEEVNMPDNVRRWKTFIMRSIIYGAALFFENGEMEFTEENLQIVRSLLDREFDLPWQPNLASPLPPEKEE